MTILNMKILCWSRSE